MDAFGIVTSEDTAEKIALCHPSVFPVAPFLNHATPDIHPCRTFFAWGEPPCQLPLTVLALCAQHNPDSTADHPRLPCSAQPQAKPDSRHRICNMLCFICGITFFMSPEIFIVDMFLFLS